MKKNGKTTLRKGENIQTEDSDKATRVIISNISEIDSLSGSYDMVIELDK